MEIRAGRVQSMEDRRPLPGAQRLAGAASRGHAGLASQLPRPDHGKLSATMTVRLRAALAALALSCASCVSLHDRTPAAVADFEAGRFEEARVALSDERVVDSAFLRGAELGMIELTAGRWDEAQVAFDRAVEAVRELEERAVLGVSELGEQAASLVINEGVKEYQGEGYERVQLHTALALTYLARGNLDGVYVEVRRANKLLETEESLYSRRYAAGGFGHLMSAISYELQGRYDDAYIDYKRMVEKEVGTELAGKALVRLAARLRYDDELPQWIERFGEPTQAPPDSASIVVLAGLGLGPYKLEETVQLMTPSGLAQFSVPRFVPRVEFASAFDLAVDGAAPLRTTQVESIDTVAAENLADRMAWLAGRSLLRGAMKLLATHAIAEGVRSEHGDAAGVAALVVGSLLTAATERADTRCWRTLPASWHAGRLWLEPGEHDVVLSAVGGERVDLGRFTLAKGETLVILARSLGSRLHVHPVGGQRVAAAPPTTLP